MSRFIVTLTDERREKLEEIRRARGDRSMADSVRWLIDSFLSPERPTIIQTVIEPDPRPHMAPGSSGYRERVTNDPLRLPVGQIRKATPKKR